MEKQVADQILKKIHDVQEMCADKFKSFDERISEAKDLANEVHNDIGEFRKNFVKPDAPLDDQQEMAVSQKGGIFGGKFQLPFKKALSFPTTSTSLAPAEADHLKKIHNLNDALVLRYWWLKKKDETLERSQILAEIQKSTDFTMYATALQQAGYIKAANDIFNPAGGDGANLDFTLLSSQLIEHIRVGLRVVAQFPEVPLTRSKMDFPALRSDAKALRAAGLTAALPPTDSTSGYSATAPADGIVQPTFGQVSFSCVHAIGFILWNDDMFEDSVVPFNDLMRFQASNMVVNAWDDAAINGDTAATMDTDASLGTDFRGAWNGLRKLSNDTDLKYNMGGAAPTAAGIALTRKLMGKYGTTPTDLVCILAPEEWLALLADSDVAQADVRGVDQAALRTGVVGRLWNMDFVTSEHVRRDVDAAAAVNSGGPNTFTHLTIVNRNRFWHGRFRDVKIETTRWAPSLTNGIQADVRSDFKAIDLDSGAFTATPSPVVQMRNVTLYFETGRGSFK